EGVQAPRGPGPLPGGARQDRIGCPERDNQEQPHVPPAPVAEARARPAEQGMDQGEYAGGRGRLQKEKEGRGLEHETIHG
ncbi:hypothetical protein D6V10_20980, partial [Vibrio cholerae]|nr:hypothetical protein [Vibrio cholerae]